MGRRAALFLEAAVSAFGLGRQQRDVAVDAHPPPVAAGKDERRAARTLEWLPVRARRIGGPDGGRPAGIPGHARGRLRLEAELPDSGPHVAPLLAHDVVEPAHRGGPGAEGDRVFGEHAAARLEVTSTTRSFEFMKPVRDLGVGHAPHYERPPSLVNDVASRYPACMDSLTIDTLKALASLQGLTLTDEELAALLPLVAATRSMTASLRDVLSSELEPASQYRII